MKNSINGHTRVIAVLGWPLTYSLSPAFQNAALVKLGLNTAYLPFPVSREGFAALLRSLKSLPSFVGANITNPYKLQALKFGRPSPQARAIGAANTLYRKGGSWIAHNTDAEGFALSLKAHGIRLKGRRVLLLGSGGSARALAYAVLSHGAEALVIAGRRKSQALLLARRFRSQGPCRAAQLSRASLPGLMGAADLVLNSVPGGAFARQAAQALKMQLRVRAVCDISYGLKHNPLLRQARAQGCKAADGTGMLLEQGALSFRLFTGRPAPKAVMAAALRNAY